ncbi:MAG: dihydroorotate dehydrogenase electron transfer subunit [Deltaproteobacteria bacterium]|nr:dihydroorotate dehydrogenase electron transfer subunit [Deltaproteobacteria bacterium]MBW2021136.1 dihydroorotate dehydrogenase electron transfer subunit [Deltaproteobacteria bacterium]MBW2075815.1 dihydroorotate dehydrogenase electron transfer subunit [Deltaproteobacteria bacterium]
MNELFQKKVQILHHIKVGSGYFRIGLAFPELARIARPGQFVMVRLPERRIPLLRRPFSVHNRLVEGEEVYGFELLYKVVGKGTRALSGLKAGDLLDVLGPLGNGFSCPEGMRDVLLVAGGIGVASLYYLALFLAEHRAVGSTVFLGGRTAADILCQRAFESMGTKVCITTEDGTLGEKGLITSRVQEALKVDGKPDMIYACGPNPMLKAVGDIAATYEVRCQISLETAMVCGFGACLGCAVEKADSRGTYFHACTDGPVFDSRAIVIQT